MRLLILVTIVLVFSNVLYAGGDYAPAYIKTINSESDKEFTIEIQWLSNRGFIADNEETKIKMILYEWPNKSFFVKNILSIFYNPYEKEYPSNKFYECIKIFKNKKLRKESVNIGQMGTVKFRTDEHDKTIIIVPYAEAVKEKDGTESCYFYAAPI